MNHLKCSYLCAATAAMLLITTPALKAELFLGPPNSTIEFVGDWFTGPDGVGIPPSFVEISPDDGYIEGTGKIIIGATEVGGEADFRSQQFSLGPAAGAEQQVRLEFAVRFMEENIDPEHAVLLQFRWFDMPEDQGGAFKGEFGLEVGAGTEGIDTGLTGEWQTFSQEIDISEFTGDFAEANYADIRTSVNVFPDGTWGSGEVHFDNIRITTDVPPLETPVAVTLYPVNTVEFDTAGEEGAQFQIEAYRPDEDVWVPVSEIITGNGEVISREFSARTESGPFRVRKN